MTFEEALAVAASRGLRLERTNQPRATDAVCAWLLQIGAAPDEDVAAKWNPKLWGYGVTVPDAITNAVDRWHDAETRRWAPLIAAAEAALEVRR